MKFIQFFNLFEIIFQGIFSYSFFQTFLMFVFAYVLIKILKDCVFYA